MRGPFAHHVVCFCLLLLAFAQSLKQVKLLATCKRAQQLSAMLAKNAASVEASVHQATRIKIVLSLS